VEDRATDPLQGGDADGPPEAGAPPGELSALTASFVGARPMSEISVASAKVAAIVEAAERAAEDLRLKTEEKVRERIAEADRAADLRVEAAEAEARELVDVARREAAAIQADAREAVRQIHENAGQAREDAERRKVAAVQEAQDEAGQVRASADTYAQDVKRNAKADARDIIQEAHEAARGVLHDGTTLSGHLNELSDSLRRNAERLLNDVKLAHARLTADLDQATPAGPAEPAPRASRSKPSGDAAAPGPPSDGEFDVPEFVPGRR
jgi:cell division septum initiation protein DivIVA